MKSLFSKLLPDVVAIAAFVLISFLYFLNPVLNDQILRGDDHAAANGMMAENEEYKAETGETSRWTNGSFAGMPTYQISPSYPSTKVVNVIADIYHLGISGYVGLVFIMLLGFYLMLRAFNFRVWLAALGAIIWAFSSYYFIIILAGHIWKFVTLAYIPPTIAGFVLAYKGKYWLGGALTAVFASLQIASNHVQMSYYFLFVMAFLLVAFLIDAWREKQFSHFFKATGVVLLAAVAAVLINSSTLYHTYEYSKHTMREKSELIKPDSENQTSSGLERDYITAWSYGLGETFSLMIPNIKGGSSQIPLQFRDDVLNAGTPQLREFYSQGITGQYWGEQPFTSGPVYVGAFVCLLFLLGCFTVRGAVKWALVGVTVLSILLSWGHNFMWFTNLFIDYFPMYAKFRTPSSILVIAEFTIPLLAILGLCQWCSNGTDKPTLMPSSSQASPLSNAAKLKQLYIALAFTGGLCLIFMLIPSLISFNVDATVGKIVSMLAGQAPQETIGVIANDLHQMLPSQYSSILRDDAFRSLAIILIGSAFLWLNLKGKLKATPMVVCITVLCLVDMWSVNKRYLKDESFTDKTAVAEVVKSQADEQILQQDSALNYRVLDRSVSTFNDNTTSFFHHSIGGYHAAKLRRYQELIEYHIAPEINYLSSNLGNLNADSISVLNMLNTRYFIIPTQGGKMAVPNAGAYGNAWFVDTIVTAQNANEEIEGLYRYSPRTTAITNIANTEGRTIAASSDSTAIITLKEYYPNRLVYESNSANGGFAVFSEVYYPEWTVSIDGGEPSSEAIIPVNYVLRGVQLPAGKHTIEFRFDPQSVHTTERLAIAGFAIILLLIGAGIITARRKKRNELKV